MKKISVVLALLALFFVDLAMAAGAVVTSITGTAQVQTGSAAPRTLRQGDEVNQGDTVFTGARSSIVMKFDDGQVAALTSNSRMTVTTYQYNPGSETGSVFLSLVTGGMRAITGLIGHRNPNNVAYRAAQATIGIRGTDGTIVTDGTDVVVTVTEGTVTVKVNGVDYLVSAGNALYYHPGSPVSTGPIASVKVPGNLAQGLAESVALTGALVTINAGQPRQGQQGDQNGQGQTQTTQSNGPQGGNGGNGGGGGGNGNGGNGSGS